MVVTTDNLLWDHAPTHAYALMGFVAFDALLLLLVWIRNPLGPRVVPAWGALQVLLMLLDILTAPTVGHTYAELAALLFANGAWVALLVTRLVQATWPLPLALATRFRAGSVVVRQDGTHPGIPSPVQLLPLTAREEDRGGLALSRRRFLKYSALGLAVVGSGVFLSRLYGLQAFAGSTSPPGQYKLSITEALVEQIDGRLVYMWVFEDLDRGRNPSELPQVPGPVLQATAGVPITLEITNNLPQAHAFAIPGIFDSGLIFPGATGTFVITIPEAGTYLYLDPLNEPANRVLGLHGALVVLPAAGNTPYTHPTANVQALFNSLGTPSQFPGEPWERERTRIWLFHQIDPVVHEMAQRGVDPREIAAFLKTPGQFTPRYFTINGESGAFAAHNHDITPEGRIGQPHLIRILNAGLTTHSPHIHANHVYVLSVNNVVQANLMLVDTWTMKPLDRVDWLLPFVRPPDIPGDPGTPLRDLIPEELALVVGGVAQSPLRYPMHCHTEMSQTAAGGNYPQGLVTDWLITGDRLGEFPRVPVNGEDGESDSSHDH